jgi:hypothetical protein
MAKMNASDILWFKLQFGPQITKAVAGTPFDVNMLTAIACQETGYIWSVLRRKGLAVSDILALCVGDTLDSDKGRRAFPRDKAQLLAHPGGDRMFEIARKGLVEMAKHVPGYAGAAGRPNKFCHGFGIFQYDLQFFKTNPDHFLGGRYGDFEACAALCVTELKRGLAKLGWTGRSSLTDYEMACVAIAYNTGGFKQGRGLKQGHKSGDRYYGEAFYDYLLQARAVALPAEPARPGEAVMPTPNPVTATGETYEVETRAGLLNLRRTPLRDPANPDSNVAAGLPDGHVVRSTGSPATNGFVEVETQLAGALLRGYVSSQYLKKIATRTPVAAPPEPPRPAGLVAVHMPRKAGTLTRRTEFAGAHPLNEPGMPGRKAATPAGLVAELDAIIGYLGVEKTAHTRYQPRAGMTFCNIYAHDFCHLAGAYLPRVWWTPGALVAIGQGQQITPKYGATIEEMRANALFRWLRDFGPLFGWRQTGTLTKLQQHANQGGLGVIVARRTQEGRPGHIVMVVPETDAVRAKRNSADEVTSPVQSQAGSRNRARAAQADWWTGAQFAEHGFWIHS